MPSTRPATPQAWFSSASASRRPRRDWKTSWVASSVPPNVAVNPSARRKTAEKSVNRILSLYSLFIPLFPSLQYSSLGGKEIYR